ncbi:STAS domain-containing protein [Magnetococcus sp. PR-3]|uniref:STAS domain-containing protein n=1 Tax=Magnetococcus sp. PR-3 TaxID=3120355 RepID=UPI002FCE3AFB
MHALTSTQDYELVVTEQEIAITPKAPPNFNTSTNYLGLAHQIPEHLKVTVDCSNFGYIDSTGIGTLIMFRQELKQKACPITLRNLAPAVKQVFKVANMHMLFHIVDESSLEQE